MRTLIIIFNGKTPSKQELEQLTIGSLFDKTSFSFVERNRKIIESILCFLAGMGGVIFSWFLFWSKIAFIPMGGPFTAFLLGFSFSLFYQGVKCFHNRPVKQNFKKPHHVLHQYVKCLLNINYFHTGMLDTGNSYAALQRMLPESQKIDYKTFVSYLSDFHSKMMTIVKNDAKILTLSEGDFRVSTVDMSVTSNKAVLQGMKKLVMEANLYVEITQHTQSTWRNKTISTNVSHIKLMFNITLIQLNEYWFVYDPLPDYKIETMTQ